MIPIDGGYFNNRRIISKEIETKSKSLLNIRRHNFLKLQLELYKLCICAGSIEETDTELIYGPFDPENLSSEL